MGINTLRAAIDLRNKTGLGLLMALGNRKYGEATLTRILFCRFWKETYLRAVKDVSN
jgi:hypothetical protein